MSKRRFQYHVTYEAKSGLWVCKVGGAYVYGSDRSSCIDSMSDRLRWAYEDAGQHSELKIHRRDGTIGKGPSSTMTYPRSSDPVRSRG